jgi:hypothetical protein
MRISAIFSLFALGLAHGDHGDHGEEVDEKDVVVLTDSSFGEWVDKHPLALIEFYARKYDSLSLIYSHRYFL